MPAIEQGPIGANLAKVAAGDSAAMVRVAAGSIPWNATLRTTCVATQLEGGHAKNALPQLAAANVNCRVLPEDAVEFVTSTLQRVVADSEVHVIVEGAPSAGPASPMRADVLTTTNALTNE